MEAATWTKQHIQEKATNKQASQLTEQTWVSRPSSCGAAGLTYSSGGTWMTDDRAGSIWS